MKKKMILIAVVLMAFFAVNSALGVSYEPGCYRPYPEDLYDLPHGYAYMWGLEIEIPEHEQISGASILFKNIRNWTEEDNDLWLTLLDEPAIIGVRQYTDYSYPENYFGNWDASALELHHYEDLGDDAQDLLYVFSQDELDALNDYLADGDMALGFDPDCHFYNDYIEFCIETSHIPEPSTAAMFSIGTVVFGLAFVGRKLHARSRK